MVSGDGKSPVQLRSMTQTLCRQRLNFKALHSNYCPTHGTGTLPTHEIMRTRLRASPVSWKTCRLATICSSSRIEPSLKVERECHEGSLPSRTLRRRIQDLDRVQMADMWIGVGCAFAWILTAAQRGAPGGKDGLSLDLNDSTASMWIDGLLFHVTI